MQLTEHLYSNWGTESDPDQSYHAGNSDPRGFGHIGLMVPDVYAACKRLVITNRLLYYIIITMLILIGFLIPLHSFEEHGVDFVKRPDDGRMKGLAFIKDPDGYWIEIFNAYSVSN